MPRPKEDRRPLILLISILLLFLVSPFATEGRSGEIIFLLSLYGTFVTATMELSEKKSLPWPSLILAGSSFGVALVVIFYPVRATLAAPYTLLAAFFGYVSVVLFRHLGRPGKITSGRLYISVSLYLLLGVFYYAVFNLLDSIHPGSFLEAWRQLARE